MPHSRPIPPRQDPMAMAMAVGRRWKKSATTITIHAREKRIPMTTGAYGQRPMAQSMPPPPGYSGGRNDPLGHHSAQQSLYFAGQNFDPGNAGLHERPHQPYHVPMYVMVHGQHETKRVRRRPEEIDRIYKCGWNDCPKGYGTLNHLNAHVTMQNHGPKRTPDQFKEIRREWKARKKEEERLRQQEITDNEKAERSRGG
ncbi:C2H2 transcription factor [Apiospora arundinis]